jgi:hypothetical protein
MHEIMVTWINSEWPFPYESWVARHPPVPKPILLGITKKVTTIRTILGTFLFLSNENRSAIKLATIYPAKISTSLSVSYHCSA